MKFQIVNDTSGDIENFTEVMAQEFEDRCAQLRREHFWFTPVEHHEADELWTERMDGLRCEAGHALYAYHNLESGVGHRLLCPFCDSGYIKDLLEKRNV